MEIRTTEAVVSKVHIEKREDGKRYIAGYAAVFYRKDDAKTEYQLYTDLYERILPGAFNDAVKEDDVRALLNHDPSLLLARTGNSLKLKEDSVGLWYEFPVDENDPDHLRVAAKLERGDLSGSSFGFVPVERRFVEYEDYDVVELAKVRLYDVSPATFPAYEGTSVGIRSADGIDAIVKERDEWKNSIKQDDDLQIRLMKAESGIL